MRLGTSICLRTLCETPETLRASEPDASRSRWKPASDGLPRAKRKEHNLNIKYVIGFVEDRQPVLFDQRVTTIDGTVVVDPVTENPDGTIVMLGETSFLDQAPEDVAAFRQELGVSPALLSDPVAMLDFRIKYQKHLTPDRVGGPVDMIRMTAAGADWVAGYRKSSCPERR